MLVVAKLKSKITQYYGKFDQVDLTIEIQKHSVTPYGSKTRLEMSKDGPGAFQTGFRNGVEVANSVAWSLTKFFPNRASTLFMLTAAKTTSYSARTTLTNFNFIILLQFYLYYIGCMSIAELYLTFQLACTINCFIFAFRPF